MRDQFELSGETVVELHDMGDECLVLCAVNETGQVEKVALEWGQLVQAVEALRPRYGTDKNTDQASGPEKIVLEV
ncbi:hypothetical protein GCM10011349_47320 [Novosphingobium indicum]|uniref:Uncharacterized protein n=1 Tax=Novosphingobium indicum TaxID=462949 RepID=A0ABQ2K3S6_9SPHN|nr:hypothetical protein [Novosphingobium indicum]GGN63064.1 hypothetical protein GCM10011349_47320 [Novosphingobium indicum]